jgi:hypothetical protein
MASMVNLGRLMLVCMVLASAVLTGPVQAVQDALLPLQATDIAAGCGCNFVRDKSKGEAPLLRWMNDGKKQGFIRANGKLQVLELRQEKHIPERPGGPKPDDRLVLFVANGDWQIQVLGMVQPRACGAKRQCSDTHYRGRMLVQQDGGARTEIPVEGSCACPK